MHQKGILKMCFIKSFTSFLPLFTKLSLFLQNVKYNPDFKVVVFDHFKIPGLKFTKKNCWPIGNYVKMVKNHFLLTL